MAWSLWIKAIGRLIQHYRCFPLVFEPTSSHSTSVSDFRESAEWRTSTSQLSVGKSASFRGNLFPSSFQRHMRRAAGRRRCSALRGPAVGPVPSARPSAPFLSQISPLSPFRSFSSSQHVAPPDFQSAKQKSPNEPERKRQTRAKVASRTSRGAAAQSLSSRVAVVALSSCF